MMSSFKERRRSWERSIEDVLVDISNEKTEEGLRCLVDAAPVIQAFNDLLNSLDKARTSGEVILIPGNRNNED